MTKPRECMFLNTFQQPPYFYEYMFIVSFQFVYQFIQSETVVEFIVGTDFMVYSILCEHKKSVFISVLTSTLFVSYVFLLSSTTTTFMSLIDNSVVYCACCLEFFGFPCKCHQVCIVYFLWFHSFHHTGSGSHLQCNNSQLLSLFSYQLLILLFDTL